MEVQKTLTRSLHVKIEVQNGGLIKIIKVTIKTQLAFVGCEDADGEETVE